MRRDHAFTLADDLGDSELHALCLRWADWTREHGMIPPPIPKNILARMQPAKVRSAPAIGLSPVLSVFNTAISAQDDDDAKTAFLVFYLYPYRSVKEAASAMDITRDAFYKRVRKFRRRAYRAAISLESASATARILRSTSLAEH